MDENDWNMVVNTNLGSVFNCSRAVIVDFMKRKSGVIINISSVSGIIGLPRQVNYSAAKAGMIGFTKALAKEVAPYNIRVNAVAPGGIETDMIGKLPEKSIKAMIDSTPQARLGKPEEVAQVVSFLASPESSYITGHVINIDGGLAI